MKSFNVRRSLFFALIVLLVVQLACGLGGNSTVSDGNGGGGDSPDFAATEQALQATQSALEAQQQQPTATTPPKPTQAPPTQAPTDPPPPAEQEDPGQTTYSSGDLIYFTDFDGPGDWEDGWVHMSVPDGGDYSIYKANGFLHIEIPETYSSVYAFYDNLYFLRDQADVYVEAYFENMGTHNINNISVVCRASEAGWYEFSILSGGLWYIWKYDGNSGNYALLKDGGIANLDYDAPHIIGASCVGDTLTFYFDGAALKNGSITNNSLREGQVGLAVYADDWKDVIVEFDYFGVQAP